MHANEIINGIMVSFPSKMLAHRKITPAAIKPKLAMMKRVFSIFFIAFFSFFILSQGEMCSLCFYSCYFFFCFH